MSKFRTLGIFILICIALNSCNRKENSNILTIPVDITKISPFHLSEISIEIQPIKLELTKHSLVAQAGRILYDGNYILLQNRKPQSILLFEKTGKFVRQIGTVGQGPKEYTNIIDIAADFKNKQVFVLSQHKLICYNFNGNFITESNIQSPNNPQNLSFVNNNLFLIGRNFREVLNNGNNLSCSSLYKINNQLQLIDSIELIRVLNPQMIWAQHWYGDHITHYSDNTYQYEFEFNPEPSLRDTLFQLEGMKRIPHIRLDFHTNGVDKNGERTLYLLNIYRSSRYIFAIYGLTLENKYYYFCYDTKTKKGYVMENGYTDDIHHSEITVNIRPLIQDTNKFYYLVTDTDNDSNLEEPNPTLYIGKLKE